MSRLLRKLAVKGQRLRIRLVGVLLRIGFKEEYFLVLVSILIGAVTGVFAHLFYGLIEYTRHFAYGGDGSAGLFGGSKFMLVLLPTLGALGVGLITYFVARESKGHGVPEVMDAIYRRGGHIRGRVAGAKAVASALTIGSGGSAGTEGPIIQIGAAIASSVGRVLGIPRREMGVVVACGVSAGIAAIFNAPIAGVLFALEIFLKDFSFRTFSPVVFSSVISCSVMHALRFEDVAIFEVGILRDAPYVFVGKELPLFLVLGLLCALLAVGFIRCLYLTEDLVERLAMPELLKPVLGALGLGIAGVLFLTFSGSEGVPAFYGNGYPAIEAVIGSEVFSATVMGLVLLSLLKLIATCLTLGSGGSGGIFAPSLLMGAALGAGFGLALHKLGIVAANSVSAYALVGMGALVAGSTHAPLTAIVMLYEITREPKVILPVMFAAIVATFGARLLLSDSIYTLKLRRRGVRVGRVSDLTILRRIVVEDVPGAPAHFVHPEDPLQRLIDLSGETDAVDFVVIDDEGAYQGMVTGHDIRHALLQPEAVLLLVVGELMRPGVPTVHDYETLDTVLDKFAQNEVESLPVAARNDNSAIASLITRRSVMARYQFELDKQSE